VAHALAHYALAHDHHTVGTGHLYQGRFKAFPIQNDERLPTVLRYVERNPLRANLVKQAEAWPWSSLWFRRYGTNVSTRLSKWPIAMPGEWIDLVNRPQTGAEVEALRRSVQRGAPFGNEMWQKKTAAKLGLEYALRPPGRPKKETLK
jgi:putative transposase